MTTPELNYLSTAREALLKAHREFGRLVVAKTHHDAFDHFINFCITANHIDDYLGWTKEQKRTANASCEARIVIRDVADVAKHMVLTWSPAELVGRVRAGWEVRPGYTHEELKGWDGNVKSLPRLSRPIVILDIEGVSRREFDAEETASAVLEFWERTLPKP